MYQNSKVPYEENDGMDGVTFPGSVVSLMGRIVTAGPPVIRIGATSIATVSPSAGYLLIGTVAGRYPAALTVTARQGVPVR